MVRSESIVLLLGGEQVLGVSDVGNDDTDLFTPKDDALFEAMTKAT